MRFLQDIRFDDHSVLAQGYLYPGTVPGGSHTITVVPEPGAAVSVRWSTEAGAFVGSTDGLSVEWTAPNEERGEGRIEALIETPAGTWRRLIRVYVDSTPLDTDQIHPAPLSEVMLHDPAPRPGDASDYWVCEDELLVTLDQSLGDADDISALFASLGTSVLTKLVGRPIYRLYNNDGGDLWAKIHQFRKLPFIEIAEPNHIYHLDIIPNDPSYNQQYCHPLQKGPEAWDVGRGSATQIIAIMDTGAGRQHPDLAAKTIDGADFVTPPGDGLGGEVPGDGIDNDNRNGVDDNVGHGVHCSGISGAITNNGVGGAGMAWNTLILGQRIFPANGDGGAASSGIVSAINWIADYNNNPANEAKIVSCNQSFGGGGFSQTTQNAINTATAAGCTFAAAAGNSNTSTPSYPANYENTIAVAATNSSDVRASFSNYGTWVDVSAAGVSIWNTYFLATPGHPNPNTYASLSGTSMATPQVAGLIALIKGNAPSLTPAEVKLQIMGTTDNIDDVNPNFRGQLGTGRINAFRALTQSLEVELEYDGALSIDDSELGFARGNRDGIINPGERVLVRPALRNVGLRGATNPVLTILDPADEFLTFAEPVFRGDSITRSDGLVGGKGFPIIVSRATPDNYERTFAFAVDDDSGDGPWEFAFTMRVEANTGLADVVPGTVADLTNGEALRPAVNMPFFALDLTGDAEYLLVKSLTVSLLGSIDPAAVSNIRLWADNGNGTYEGPNGDRELGLRSYWNASYHNNFDRQADPAAKLGGPQDRNIWPGAGFNATGAVTFTDLQVPVPENGIVRLFVSANIARAAEAGSTVGLAVLSESDIVVSAGDAVTGFPWGSATVPVVPAWDTEAIFAQAGSSQSWRAKADVSEDGHVYVVYDACCFSDFDIFMRKSSDGGFTWGAETAIVTNNANDYFPDVAAGPDGGVYVSWYNTRHGNNNREIYFKGSSDYGATWGSEVRVTNLNRNGRVPRIMHADGELHIVWFDNVASQSRYDVYHTISTDKGATWSPHDLVSQTPVGRVADEPQIIKSGTTLYTAWFDYAGTFGNPGNNHRVVYNFKPEGGSWGTPITITPDTELAYGVKLAVGPDGSMIAAYHSNRDGNFDIWLQQRKDAGEVSLVKVTDWESFPANNPHITRMPDGRIDLVYEVSFDNNVSNIFHQWIEPDGTPGDRISQLSQNTSGLSERPFMVREAATGNMWAWWDDNRPSGTKTWYSALLN